MSKLISLLLSLLAILLCHAFTTEARKKTTFIIHMNKSMLPEKESFEDHLISHSGAKILYVYKNVLHGYSVQLSPDEAKLLEEQPGVLSVQADQVYQLHTTRSPEFLGLLDAPAAESTAPAGDDVIVGVLDTGVWPGIGSFDDRGLGPVPSTWKGECQLPTCNRKLVGASFFSQGYEASLGGRPIDEKLESMSPIDDLGHGTHTSTTVAGSPVFGANLLGSAKGTARGMAPHARLAMYKVCWRGGCFVSDTLAAMEKAIDDGVDILSLSFGGKASDYYTDVVAIGAFAAMARGILVSCSAGNSGPRPGSLSNVAPWIMTVGAGTMDREFPTTVTLGNGKTFAGATLYSELLTPIVPLVYGGSNANSSFCTEGSLIPEEVEGKIVVCDSGMGPGVLKGLVVKNAGGVGMILSNTDTFGDNNKLTAYAHFLPAAAVGLISAAEMKRYIATDRNPTASIAPGTTLLGVQPTPLVAAFSSRGPNPITPDVLKPDLIAPGVNILAGWTGRVGPTGFPQDIRQVDFNIISGTSMSCPHVSGLAALLKAAHPEWSPAAIRSALMTTAYIKYNNREEIQDLVTGRPATPWDYGSGHVNPVPSLDPGLVYDATVQDYADFLCAIKYSRSMIQVVTKQDYACDPEKEYRVADLNYPSFSVPLLGGGAPTVVVEYTRTVTNVGSAAAVYRVSVSQGISDAVEIVVVPDVLDFSEQYEKKAYTVRFTANSMPSGTTAFARLEWSDGEHIVGSPIVFSWT